MKGSRKSAESKNAILKKRISVAAVVFVIAVFSLTVSGLFLFTYRLLFRSDTFIVRESRIEWLNGPLSKKDYDGLKKTGVGENIFKFNISEAARRIIKEYPTLKSIAVERQFPDRLNLKARARLPVAQVGDASYFLVDDEAVVLTEPGDFIREDLPIITGIGWRFFRKVGQKEDSPRMERALSFLWTIKEGGFLNNHVMTKIDISDYRNLSFFIEDGIEIRIGHSNFKERLVRLDDALSAMSITKDKIEYIDLRFDDIVVGPK